MVDDIAGDSSRLPASADCLTSLDGVPDGYRAIDEREAIKVMIEP